MRRAHVAFEAGSVLQSLSQVTQFIYLALMLLSTGSLMHAHEIGRTV